MLRPRGSVAGSVIQATGTVEFEDGLRTGVLLEAACALRGAAPSLGSIPNPPGGAGWYWGGVVVIGTLLSDQKCHNLDFIIGDCSILLMVAGLRRNL